MWGSYSSVFGGGGGGGGVYFTIVRQHHTVAMPVLFIKYRQHHNLPPLSYIHTCTYHLPTGWGGTGLSLAMGTVLYCTYLQTTYPVIYICRSNQVST